MNPSDRVVRYVTRRAPVWQKRLGLEHWTIKHVYLDDERDDAIATTDAMYQYLQAKVKWYLPLAVQQTDTELEAVLVHELAHVLLAPVGVLVRSDQERDCELLELSAEMTCRALLRGW